MGKPKYIYLTDENHMKLTQEDNSSALVNRLLFDYYHKIKEEEMTPVEKDIKMAQELENKKAELDQLQSKYDEMMNEIHNQHIEDLERQKEEDRIRELKRIWSEEMKPIPFDDRTKFETWLNNYKGELKEDKNPSEASQSK